MLGKDITKDYFTDLYGRIREVLELHEEAAQHYRPLLDGVRYMTDKELSEMPKVILHTLQQYRNKGLIPFAYWYYIRSETCRNCLKRTTSLL